MGYSFRLTARVLLYAPSHRQDSTYRGLCYTSCVILYRLERYTLYSTLCSRLNRLIWPCQYSLVNLTDGFGPQVQSRQHVNSPPVYQYSRQCQVDLSLFFYWLNLNSKTSISRLIKFLTFTAKQNLVNTSLDLSLTNNRSFLFL